MKKGFTLIELLAVIIILAVIALIATPVVLNVVEEAKVKADRNSVYGLIDAAKLYYAESLLDSDKKAYMNGTTNVLDYLVISGEGPESGKIFINDKGQSAIAVVYGKVCFTKNFSEFELSENDDIENCDIGIEETIPSKPDDEVVSCEQQIGKTFDFGYTGDVQEFTTLCNGIYKLEVWGAQGGAGSGIGGKGGYSYGNIELKEGNVLYIAVGGQGVTAKTERSKGTGGSLGGYNGGGAAGGGDDYFWSGSGGGATHIATLTGTLSELSENQESVLIVAGGGGGGASGGKSNSAFIGGTGGGTTGGTGEAPNASDWALGTGGTQTAGGTGTKGKPNYGSVGSFGTGGSLVSYCGAGGGGGWYGGGSGSYYNGTTPGGGGSGYIGGVTEGQTIAGNESIPTHDGTSTMTGNTGDGYAKITLLSIEE